MKSFSFILAISFFVASLSRAEEQRQFPACQDKQIKFIDSDTWAKNPKAFQADPYSVWSPTAIGNFDSVNEAYKTLSPGPATFVRVVVGSILQIAQQQEAYAQAAANCLGAAGTCTPQMRESIQKDRQAIREAWSEMRLGLALGFTSFLCAGTCVSYEDDLTHPFQWAKTFAKPSAMGMVPTSKDRDIPGALSKEEEEIAAKKVFEINGEILNRPIDWWERFLNTDPGATPEMLRVREAAYALENPGPNGEPSFRQFWRERYFDAIRLSPLSLLVSRPILSDRELQSAYLSVVRSSRELQAGFKTADTMQPWDYLSLTTRDILLNYVGVIDGILTDVKYRKYCGIAERMLAEKISNDHTKLVIAVGSTVATGVGCVLTGSTYIGLSLCALTSLGLAAKSDLDIQDQAEEARKRATSSATPSLLVDDFESISDVDRQAIFSQNMRYLSLIDVAILGGATLKLTGKALIFLHRLEKFTAELVAKTGAEPRHVRAALKVILRDSPSFKVASRASALLGRLPKGSINQENAAEIGRASRALAELARDEDLVIWSGRLNAAVMGGIDSLRGLSVVSERAQSIVLLEKTSAIEAYRKALDIEVSRIQIVQGKFLPNAAKRSMNQRLQACFN